MIEGVATPATPGYRFTGNQYGVSTRPEMVVHSIELVEGRVRAHASIGISRVSFEMTIEQALAADIIERV
jgi:hypothetical protein